MTTITVNGLPVYYEEYGHGDPLILLHGLGSRAADWVEQTPSFSQYYRTIVPDLRGHGHTGRPPGPYTLTQMAADVAALQEAIGAAAAHVVGLSLGGMVALELALGWPENVRSLVITNSVASMIPRGLAERFGLLQRQILVAVLGPGPVGAMLSRRLFPKPEQAALRQVMAERWKLNDRASYRAAMQAVFGWSVADRLVEIRCPVLVISGDDDYLPMDRKRELAAGVQDGRLLVIADSRHGTPVDQPDAYNAAVLAFLSAQSSVYSAQSGVDKENPSCE